MTFNPEIKAGQSVELLKELHILTRDGKLNQDSRRKLKQVNHLLQFITPVLREAFDLKKEISLIDHGAGKSYLGFMLYDDFFKDKDSGYVYGIETRNDLVEKSSSLAQHLGFERMRFLHLSVEESIDAPQIPRHVDVVTALHACDTATDDAIRFALHKNAAAIILVPCCQAEVASLLRQHKNEALAKTFLSELWRHPIHTRELGSHLTNVLRCLQLQAHGYQVTVTELVGWEHSMKNELIIAKKTSQKRADSGERLKAILKEFHLEALQSRFFIPEGMGRSQNS